MKLKNKDLILIFKKTNGRCFYCNKWGEEIDHFISRQKHIDWGLKKDIDINDLENLFLACSKCNHKKRDKTPEDFIGNSYICWNRHDKANLRVGLIEEIYED